MGSAHSRKGKGGSGASLYSSTFKFGGSAAVEGMWSENSAQQKVDALVAGMRSLDGVLTDSQKQQLRSCADALLVGKELLICVLQVDGSSTTISLPSSETVKQLKRELSSALGIEEFDQSLILPSTEGDDAVVPLLEHVVLGGLVSTAESETPDYKLQLILLVSPGLPCTGGLSLWLDFSEATQTDGNALRVQDKSPSGSDAVQDCFNTAPTLSSAHKGQNGRSVLRFKRGDGLVGSAGCVIRTIVLVMRWVKPCNLSMVFAQYKNQDFSLRFDAKGFRGNRSDGNDWQHGRHKQLYVNGVKSLDAKVGSWVVVCASKRGGRADDPFRYQLSSQFMQRYFTGDMAEVIGYDRELEDQERRDVEQHLSSKWGIPLARHT